jgi:hypothetical protein
MTGVNNVEAFALGAVYGVGFEYTVGGGVAIFTGTVFDEYNGLFFFVSPRKDILSFLSSTHSFECATCCFLLRARLARSISLGPV